MKRDQHCATQRGLLRNQKPASDDELGMAWWNGLTKPERKRWANLAGTGRAKDAWELFKQTRARMIADDRALTWPYAV
jgi:hypothetical protein